MATPKSCSVVEAGAFPARYLVEEDDTTMSFTTKQDPFGDDLESRLMSYDEINTEVGVKEGRRRFFQNEEKRKGSEEELKAQLLSKLEVYKRFKRDNRIFLLPGDKRYIQGLLEMQNAEPHPHTNESPPTQQPATG